MQVAAVVVHLVVLVPVVQAEVVLVADLQHHKQVQQAQQIEAAVAVVLPVQVPQVQMVGQV
tara:strand:- start:125 stop:307 length:183 start_codon:yes stop_codon:yes gene_type:complete